jgi:hypothetical protein
MDMMDSGDSQHDVTPDEIPSGYVKIAIENGHL